MVCRLLGDANDLSNNSDLGTYQDPLLLPKGKNYAHLFDLNSFDVDFRVGMRLLGPNNLPDCYRPD